ncbi:type VI secretion system-associated FHA domain protein TagH, partial [Vibrio anguillarum]
QLFAKEGLDLLKDGPLDDISRDEDEPEPSSMDPIAALDDLLQGIKQEESLLEETEKPLAQAQHSLVPEYDSQQSQLQFTPQADSEYEMTSSIRLKKILGFGKTSTDLPPIPAVEHHETAQPPTHLNINNSIYNVPEGLAMDDKVLDLLE